MMTSHIYSSHAMAFDISRGCNLNRDEERRRSEKHERVLGRASNAFGADRVVLSLSDMHVYVVVFSRFGGRSDRGSAPGQCAVSVRLPGRLAVSVLRPR